MSASIKDRVTEFGQARWADFRAFSPGQKVVTIAALAALLIGGYVLATWKTTPAYAPLYTNLSASDASSIVDKLNSSGVSYKLGQGGTEVLVPQSKVYATRLTMSAAGLPNNGQSSYALLDKEGVTTSQFKQQIDYQRAVEGELGRTIESISGVQSASVHLAIPQQDVFNDGSSKPSAAVLLSVAPGTQLTGAQVQSVVYLVSSSVPQMAPTNVTVTDSNGSVLKAPGDTVAGGADSQGQQSQDYDNRIAASLQAMLDRALGAGHAMITVNSQLDFSKTSTTDKHYVYDKNSPPVSESKSTEVYNGAGAAAGGGGTLGTTQAGSSTASATPGKYSKTNATIDYALGTVTQTTENSPGALKNLSVGVMLDSSVKGLNVAKISNLVKSGVGYNAARGDQVSVQAVPFDNSAAKQSAAAAKASAKAAAAKASQAKLISLAKQGGLALLVLIALGWVWLGGRKKRKKRDAEPNDDILDFADDDLLGGAADPVNDRHLRSVPENASLRSSLVTVADNRPKDVARLLSDWLDAKESDRK